VALKEASPKSIGRSWYFSISRAMRSVSPADKSWSTSLPVLRSFHNSNWYTYPPTSPNRYMAWVKHGQVVNNGAAGNRPAAARHAAYCASSASRSATSGPVSVSVIVFLVFVSVPFPWQMTYLALLTFGLPRTLSSRLPMRPGTRPENRQAWQTPRVPSRRLHCRQNVRASSRAPAIPAWCLAVVRPRPMLLSSRESKELPYAPPFKKLLIPLFRHGANTSRYRVRTSSSASIQFDELAEMA